MLDHFLSKINNFLGDGDDYTDDDYQNQVFSTRRGRQNEQNIYSTPYDDADDSSRHVPKNSRKSAEIYDQNAQNHAEKPYVPKTLDDFIGVIKRTPISVLDKKGRGRIAAVMSFDDRTVAELMVPKSEMVFVGTKDLLGPLMLDKLYKSGFTNFPVIDAKEHVKGIIHTEALNALEIRKTDRAEKYMDKTISYLHTTDSLEFVVGEIERTNSYYFLVLDSTEQLAGFFTAKFLLDYLLG